MYDATIIYTVNLLIGAILAIVLSRQIRLTVGGVSPRTWVLAAWVLSAADLLFVLRGHFPDTISRNVPTVAVTVGHAVLLLAAREWMGNKPRFMPVAAIVAAHALLLLLAGTAQDSGWRTVANSGIWSALSFAAAAAMFRPNDPRARIMAAPALVLAAQGTFHLGRIALAGNALVSPTSGSAPLVQLLGDLEVSLFMVALFVSVLVSFLQQNNRELRDAMDNVSKLSGLLPLCAWCKNVRNDDGYWTRIEEYLATQSINVTHGLCESCMSSRFGEQGEDVRAPTTVSSPAAPATTRS